MAIYLFLINGVLWAWQWSDYAHLQYQPSNGIKKHMYQINKDISVFTQARACRDGRMDGRTDGRTDSHPDFNSSLHPDHLYIYNPISNSISFR